MSPSTPVVRARSSVSGGYFSYTQQQTVSCGRVVHTATHRQTQFHAADLSTQIQQIILATSHLSNFQNTLIEYMWPVALASYHVPAHIQVSPVCNFHDLLSVRPLCQPHHVLPSSTSPSANLFLRQPLPPSTSPSANLSLKNPRLHDCHKHLKNLSSENLT